MLGVIIVFHDGFRRNPYCLRQASSAFSLIAGDGLGGLHCAAGIDGVCLRRAGRRLRLFTGAMFRRAVIRDTDDRRSP